METKLKPFDIEAAKAGAKVVTRSGQPVRIICTDRRGYERPIVTLIDGPNGEITLSCRINGRLYDSDESMSDLFMAPVKRSGWVKLYRSLSGNIMAGSLVYESESAARDHIQSGYGHHIATVPVEWEE